MEIDLNSIVPQPQAAPTIDLTQATPKETLSEEAVEARSKRYMESAKELLNTDEESIRHRLKSGDEEGFRLDLVNAMQARETARRERAIGEVAKTKGRSLSVKEYNALMQSSLIDPLTAPESEYAKSMLKVLDDPQSELNTLVTETDDADRSRAQENVNIAHDYTTKVALLKAKKEEIESLYKKQGWFGWTIDQAKSLIPGHTDYNMRGNVPGVGMLEGGIARSTNYREQQRELFRKPLHEFKAILDNTTDNMKATNPTLARDWVNAMDGHSATEDALADAGILLDYVGVPGTATLGKGLSKLMSKATGDVVKAVANDVGKAGIKAAAGDIDGAAISKAADQITRNAKGIEFTTAKDTLDKLPSALRVDQKDFLANPPLRMAEHEVDRITNMWNQASESLVKIIDDKVNLQRTPILQATEEVVRDHIANAMIRKHIAISEQMFDISAPIFDKAVTTLSVDLKFGDSTGRLFTSAKTAERFIKEHGLLGAKVEQQGTRFYVKLNQSIRETDNWVKDLIKETAVAKNPDSFINAWVGTFRNPDDLLSKHNTLQRKLATMGPSIILDAAKDIAKSFNDLKKGVVSRNADGTVAERMFRIGKKNKQRWDEFQRTLIANRKMENPDRPDTPGYMFKDTNELDNFYMNNFHRLPDPVEVQAYFAFKTITEMDRQINNLRVLRNMHRMGAEKHRMYVRDTVNAKVHQNTFNGIKQNALPATDDTIAIFGNTLDKLEVVNAGNLRTKSPKYFKQLNDEIKAGRKVAIELWSPEDMPLQNIPQIGADTMPKWVILDKVDTMPLDFEQIPRAWGGHFQYEYDNYIKQANILTERVGNTVRHRYLGDNTMMPVAFRAMGNDVVKIMNDIRIKLKAKDIAGAKAIFDDMAPVGLNWNEVHSWFKSQTINGTRKPALFNLDEPFMVVDRNTKIADMNKDAISKRYMDPKGFSTFIDETTAGSPARRMQVSFTEKRDARDLYTITNKGTRDNPAYNYEPAKFVDPLLSMDKAYSSIANSAYMDDYKIMSVENWVEQALPLMNVEERQIRQAPFHFFHNAEEYFAKGADATKVANMQAAKKQIEQLLGVRSQTDNLLHSSAQKLADSLYTKFGSVPLDPVWLAPKLRDPFRFMRSMAFDMKLGMFNPAQFIVQSQSWVNIAAIGGLRAAATAIPAANFSRLAMKNQNPEILKHMDNLMTKFKLPGASWKPGEWLESNEAMFRSGWNHVGGETAMRDDHLGPRLIRSGVGNFLDWGRVFFTEGERMSRMGAWHSAYKEFRKKVPHGRLTDANIAEILGRADDLTINMTRASSSALHTGVLSIPTQFLSYQIRLGELMLGKRITMAERARVVAFNSFAYGMPIIPGVFGLPFTDDIKKTAMEHGYVVGDSWLSSVMEGVPAALIAAATGGGDIGAGNWYNIQDRFGPQGFEVFRDTIRSDKTVWEILGGPALSTAHGLWSATADPLFEMAMSGLRGDQKLVKITPNTVFDAFKEISSVNSAWRTIAAINTGRWMSKNEQYLTDVSNSSAIFMGLTGLQPQSTTDAFLKSQVLKDKKAYEDEIEKRFIKEYRRGLDVAVTDPASAQIYFDRAFALMNVHLPHEKRLGIIAKAWQNHEPLDRRIDKSYYLRYLTPGEHKDKLDAYEKKLRLQEKGLR